MLFVRRPSQPGIRHPTGCRHIPRQKPMSRQCHAIFSRICMTTPAIACGSSTSKGISGLGRRHASSITSPCSNSSSSRERFHKDGVLLPDPVQQLVAMRCHEPLDLDSVLPSTTRNETTRHAPHPPSAREQRLISAAAPGRLASPLYR